jgi:hypothetical protein
MKVSSDRLDLSFVSKAAQAFGLGQAAGSGVISARSDMQCRAIGFRGVGFVEGDCRWIESQGDL